MFDLSTRTPPKVCRFVSTVFDDDDDDHDSSILRPLVFSVSVATHTFTRVRRNNCDRRNTVQVSIRNLFDAMAPLPVPKQPLKFVFEMTMFCLLLVPGILWALVKKFMPANQKSVKGQVVLVSNVVTRNGRFL